MSKRFFKKCSRKVDKTKTYKSWVFTLNNYTEEELATLESWGEAEVANHMVVGIEQGKKGTIHLQGAVTFKQAKRFAAVKKLQERAHWEVMICINSDAAFEYCRKDGEVVIDFDNGVQGKRSDLDQIHDDIKKGVTTKHLWENYWGTMVRNHKGIEVGAKVITTELEKSHFTLESYPTTWKRWTGPKPLVYWGDTGIGKTNFALAQFKSPLLVTHMDDLALLDPREHDAIIFDDMDFKHIPRTAQIHLLDLRKSSVHIRYRTATIPSGFPRVFTTNTWGGMIFEDDPAIRRRVEFQELLPFEHVEAEK